MPTASELQDVLEPQGIAAWVVEELNRGFPTIVGIDHGFSFPLKYFRKQRLALDWDGFLDDFCAHWPTDHDHTYVDFIRDDIRGNGAARTGYRRWRRVTEERVGGKSVFHFDVQGQVAKSTHAGLPWLRYIRRHAKARVHFWPFDGWLPAAGQSVIVEVYPRLWSGRFVNEGRTGDQHDAFSVVSWLQQADRTGALAASFRPALDDATRRLAHIEGWILTSERHELPGRKHREAKNRGRNDVISGTALARERAMPELSRFFGIVIAMFYSEHGAPHFHASYGEYRASIEIQTGAVRGNLPPRVAGFVLEWRALHVAELLENWQRARGGRPLAPIPPLE